MEQTFDNIRPYNPDELHDAFSRLIKEPTFLALIQQFMPQIPVEQVCTQLLSLPNATAFQKTFIVPLLNDIEAKHSKGITASGIDTIQQPALFVSNHRDIVMDSALMDLVLFRAGLDSVEIGIGDNLLAAPWIRTLVRINKSFIVQRGLPVREMPKAFQELSGYIRHAITKKQTGVWIAQREGRAKDSNDRTQESILKMFALSGTKSFIENLKELNICPATISYEYDPCDYLKAKEFQQKRDNANFKKSPQDDLLNMKTGIMGDKGHVHFTFTPSINSELEQIEVSIDNRKAQIEAVVKLIDQRIHSNYTIYPINKVAYDELLNTTRFTAEVSPEERSEVESYLEQQLNKIDLPNNDYDFLRHKLLEMYANPLINYLAAKQNTLNI
ncbi:MAG: 1-acyl-sn-glycerol-3-phosphate acyltransferase [Paludibacteraceae bacterium]|nr:1-acyl-sn-glycerol-3-phosphate acyltransferase [Paludibacteraceae bacterium]